MAWKLAQCMFPCPILTDWWRQVTLLLLFQQEENNNTITNEHGSSRDSPQRSPNIAELGRKFTIAAANPILAEKLATPSEGLNLGGQDGGAHLATLTPKIEKGKKTVIVNKMFVCVWYLSHRVKEMV